ncbi:MAG: hypothetical protein NTY02_13050, partial [Acidobacteria bacterium]|nr:hypothetical protein [Acidobacteriota bacterium]
SRNRPVTPPEPPKPICKDAGECFQKGRDESVARRFAAAIPFLQRALEFEPGHLLSLQLLGAIEANAGNYDAAGGYMEQVVKRGGDVLFGVMRERSLSYETGHILTINRNIITLTNPKSQAVFAEQPSKVEPREIRRMSRSDRMMPHENASLEVRAATKKYVLYPMPRGVECVSSVSGPFPDCPGGGDLMFGYAGLIKQVLAAAATVPAGK